MAIIIEPPTITQPTTSTSFFSLPPELRNKIYDLTLCGSAPSVLCIESKEELVKPVRDERWAILDYAIRERRPSSPEPLRPSRNALMHTCRQAYHEAARFYYEENNICVFSGPVCKLFINSLLPAHIESIRFLEIRSLTIRRPVVPEFRSQRSSLPELPDGEDRRMCTIHDVNFMDGKLLMSLRAFKNLRTLRFTDRWVDNPEQRPEYFFGELGPSPMMLARLIALGTVLEHLEEISVSSYLGRIQPRSGDTFFWRPLPDDVWEDLCWRGPCWTYSHRFIEEDKTNQPLPLDAYLYVHRASGRHALVVETLKRESNFRYNNFSDYPDEDVEAGCMMQLPQ